MNPLKQLPNFLTCLNLLCGCFAIVSMMNGNMTEAAFLVVAAAVFDFFDGFAARALNASSPIGGDLDSLADMVTFGVVPGLMLLHYLAEGLGVSVSGFATLLENPALLVPFLVPVCAALRLAKFNVDTRQSDRFLGLPTPASAMWVMAVPLIVDYAPQLSGWDVAGIMTGKWFILGSSIGLSAIMVSELPLLAMKFKGFGWKGNGARYALLIISVVLLIILRMLAIPAILSLYVLISIVDNLFNKEHEVQS